MRMYAIGGYNEVGMNMSAVEVDGEVIILDMGTYMDKLIAMEEEYETTNTQELINLGIVPNDSILKGKRVKAIVLSHGHLDHINAVPKLAEKYNCPILGTPYTLQVLERILIDNKKKGLLKKLYKMEYGDTAEISKFKIELMNITHSIPHSSVIALHTPEGLISCAYDYKLDNTPTLGEKPDYRGLRKLSKEGIKLHISECVRVREEMRTPSEQIAKIMVQDVIDRAYEDNSSAVIITTFASQIARIKSIIEANKDQRKLIILGRSMESYLSAAQTLNLIDLERIEVYGRGKTVKRVLEQIKNPSEYLILCTGNQGEPDSVLARMSRGEYKFKFQKEDQIIFSSEVIPTPVNRANRYVLERNLQSKGARILGDVHVSGHAKREDHRDLLRMINPEYVIPCHGETERLASYASLAAEEGYVIGDTVRIMQNGRYVDIK